MVVKRSPATALAAAMAIHAIDKVRHDETRNAPQAMTNALGTTTERTTLEGLAWGVRKTALDRTIKQFDAMHSLRRSDLRSVRAWRLRMALREIYRRAVFAQILALTHQASPAIR